ncbi:CLUMA_CG007429, isoform A [Clunio marinus]|uniref:CLUMA_CG007429, isoform A n=1 Tax=Clunio marinus TaxID=568069 RepID=A0A1J1I4T0_9DIPT|nr:CLUMA_CG007429, isoform A [Clunio marinus]
MQEQTSVWFHQQNFYETVKQTSLKLLCRFSLMTKTIAAMAICVDKAKQSRLLIKCKNHSCRPLWVVFTRE